MRFEAIAGVGALLVFGMVHGLDAARTDSSVIRDFDPSSASPLALEPVSAAPAWEPIRAASPESKPVPAAPPSEPVRTALESEAVSAPPEREPDVTRIALQAGHWRAHEAPRELSGLRGNGTAWQGIPEWETNLKIARSAGAMLEELGYAVDILPAVVPPSYRADLFIAIHADGSDDSNASGYRVASPRRDATGRASRFASLLGRQYGEATNLTRLPSVTRRMRNYYAFNYRRYRHALHPQTVGVIIETGFLTSPRDRRVILNDPDRAARGIVAAVAAFPETRQGR